MVEPLDLPLEEAAVDEDPAVPGLEEVATAGDGPGGPGAGELR